MVNAHSFIRFMQRDDLYVFRKWSNMGAAAAKESLDRSNFNADAKSKSLFQ